MAYHIETDLRSVVYRHLTRLSFSFYDRIQSGQVISRANSDIRSVQMFLAFAPLIMISGVGIAVTPLSVIAITAMYGLEILVAFIQAYVFTILTCVYLKDALHPHH